MSECLSFGTSGDDNCPETTTIMFIIRNRRHCSRLPPVKKIVCLTFPSRSDAQKQRYEQVQQRVLRASLRGKHVTTEDILQGVSLAEGYHVQGDQTQHRRAKVWRRYLAHQGSRGGRSYVLRRVTDD